jgi:hypothetical protein
MPTWKRLPPEPNGRYWAQAEDLLAHPELPESGFPTPLLVFCHTPELLPQLIPQMKKLHPSPSDWLVVLSGATVPKPQHLRLWQGLRWGVFIPGDREIPEACAWTPVEEPLGAHLEVLRKMQLLTHELTVVADPALVQDTYHFAELTAPLAEELLLLQEGQLADTLLAHWNRLRV